MTAPRDDRYRVTLMLEAIGRIRTDLHRFGFEDFSKTDSDARKILRSDLVDLVEPAESLSKAFVSQNNRLDVARLLNLRNHQLVHEYPELDAEDVWSFLGTELDRVESALKHARFPK